MTHKIETPKAALNFLLAGKAVVTLKSEKTGDHLTFKIKKPRSARDSFYFVAVLDHADGLGGYTYLGTVSDLSFRIAPRHKTPYEASSKPAKAFDWALQNLAAGRMPTACEVWHEGTCGRCNRALTDPESIARGIGPECIKKVGK